jgi:hypothetical protein
VAGALPAWHRANAVKNNTSERWLIAICVLLLAGAGLWWYFSGEYEDRLVYQPDNTRLSTEYFHVAQRFLRQQGFKTHTLYHLNDLELINPNQATLFVRIAPGMYNDLEVRQLWHWVDNGGHLIAPAPGRLGSREPGIDLNPHGITSCQRCSDQALNGKGNSTKTEAEAESRQALPWVTLKRSDNQTLSLWGWARLAIENPDPAIAIWPNDHDQALVASYRISAGRITLIPTSAWLDNQHLLYPDHARLLLDLVGDDSQSIYLQQRILSGGLLGWLLRQTPWLWLAAALLALAWIWSRMPRLGPLRPAGLDHGTQIGEHVLATARFDWRHNRARKLIGAMREQQLLKFVRRYPDWRQIDRREQIARLKHLCPDLPNNSADNRLAWFLDLDQVDRPEQLTEFVSLHRRLMHAL